MIWVTFLSAGAISFVGRILSDFDEPGEGLRDVIRGIGVRVVAFMIAVLDLLRVNRRLALNASTAH